jgi:hypothetical protein
VPDLLLIIIKKIIYDIIAFHEFGCWMHMAEPKIWGVFLGPYWVGARRGSGKGTQGPPRTLVIDHTAFLF